MRACQVDKCKFFYFSLSLSLSVVLYFLSHDLLGPRAAGLCPHRLWKDCRIPLTHSLPPEGWVPPPPPPTPHMHTCTHTHTCTCTCRYTRASAHKHARTLPLPTCTHICTHTHMCTHTHVHTSTCMHTHVDTQTQAYAHTGTHMQAYTYQNTHTLPPSPHAHTHTHAVPPRPPSPQGPQRVGFRAVVVSPTRELAQQTYRECLRLSAGSGFKVHVLTKAKASANSFGPESSQRFGESGRLTG